jgi:hypothetical protein
MLGIRFQVEREVVELDRRDARSGIEALRGRTGRCQQDRADAVDRLVLGIRIRIPLRHVQLQGRREVADRLEAEGREQLLRRQRDHLADGRRIAAGIRSVAETGERQARVSAARDIGECGGRCAPGDEQQGSCQNPPTKVSFFRGRTWTGCACGNPRRSEPGADSCVDPIIRNTVWRDSLTMLSGSYRSMKPRVAPGSPESRSVTMLYRFSPGHRGIPRARSASHPTVEWRRDGAHQDAGNTAMLACPPRRSNTPCLRLHRITANIAESNSFACPCCRSTCPSGCSSRPMQRTPAPAW